MKKLVLSLFLLFPFNGCTSCGLSNPSKDVKPYYDIQRFKAQPWQVTRLGNESYGTVVSVKQVPEAQPIIADSLVIALMGEVTYYGQNEQLRGGGGWAAYACDPMPSGFKGTTEEVQEITVRCDQDFDAAHPAGSSLNVYFDYFAGSPYSNLRTGNLNEFSKQLPVQAAREFMLKLMKAPDQKTGTYTFTVEYALTNGEVLTARTRNITFK